MDQGRVKGRHLPPHGLVILVEGNGFKLSLAFGRRLDRGEDVDAILGMEVLDKLTTVPLFVRNHEKVSLQDGAGQGS